MNGRRAMGCAVGVLVLLAAGCAGPTEIPVGSWSGQGRFVDYEAAGAAAPAGAGQRSESRPYPTELRIAPTRAYGREALRFEIVSRRGKLFNVPGEETELKFILVPLERLGAGTLYAGFSEDAPAAGQMPAGAAARGVAFRTAGGLVLQVDYGEPGGEGTFTDTFHFLADRVIKTGLYTAAPKDGEAKKTARVWWVEQLRPGG